MHTTVDEDKSSKLCLRDSTVNTTTAVDLNVVSLKMDLRNTGVKHLQIADVDPEANFGNVVSLYYTGFTKPTDLFIEKLNSSFVTSLTFNVIFDYSKVTIPLKAAAAKTDEQYLKLQRFDLEVLILNDLTVNIVKSVPCIYLGCCNVTIFAANIKYLNINRSIIHGNFVVDKIDAVSPVFTGRVYVSNVTDPHYSGYVVNSTLQRLNDEPVT